MTGGGLAVGVCRDTLGDMAATWMRHGAQQRALTRNDTATILSRGPAIRTVLGL